MKGRLMMAWVPAAIFALGPLLILVAIYSWRAQASFLSGLLLLLLLGFVVYLGKFQREKVVIVGSILPTGLGPLLASQALKGADSPLYGVYVGGHGDFLVNLAFFMAGVMGLFIYGIQRATKIERSRRDVAECSIAVIGSFILILWMALTSRAFFTPSTELGPEFFMGLNYPAPTQLFWARVALVVLSIGLVTVPNGEHRSAS